LTEAEEAAENDTGAGEVVEADKAETGRFLDLYKDAEVDKMLDGKGAFSWSDKKEHLESPY